MFGIRHTSDRGRGQRTGRGEKWPTECVELTFCRKEGICYRFNRMLCFNDNCLHSHVCKRCWAVDGVEEHHASDDIEKCKNMSQNYMNALKSRGGDGDQVSQSAQENQDDERQSARGGAYQFSQHGYNQQSGSSNSIEHGYGQPNQPSRHSASNLSLQRRYDQSTQPSGRGGSNLSIQGAGAHVQSTQPSGRGGSSHSIQGGNDLSTQASGRGGSNLSLQRGNDQFTQPSGRGGSNLSIQGAHVQSTQPFGRGGSSHSIQGGNYLSTQASGRGGSNHSIRGGHDLSSQPSGRGGSNHSIRGGFDLSTQPSVHGGSNHSIQQPLDLTSSTSGPHSRHTPVDSDDNGQDNLEHDSQEVKIVNDSLAMMTLREEIINLKTTMLATRSDLLDEKTQHQMLQVKYVELTKKYDNMAQENINLKEMLERNRRMQRLWPCFNGRNSSAPQNGNEGEEMELGDRNFNVYGTSDEVDDIESGGSDFDLFGRTQSVNQNYFG